MMNTMKKVFMGAAALMWADFHGWMREFRTGNSGTATPETGGSGTDAAGAVKIGLHYELTGRSSGLWQGGAERLIVGD